MGRAIGFVLPYVNSQPLDIESLESVVRWLAHHAKPDLRVKMCALAAPALLDAEIQRRLSRKPRRRPRRS